MSETIHVAIFNGYLCPDDKGNSKILFEHLHPDKEYGLRAVNLDSFKMLARAHGWRVKVRKGRKDEYEDDY